MSPVTHIQCDHMIWQKIAQNEAQFLGSFLDKKIAPKALKIARWQFFAQAGHTANIKDNARLGEQDNFPLLGRQLGMLQC